MKDHTIINEVDIFFLMMFSEADRVGIIDHEWYKIHLKEGLKLINFNHFAEPDAHMPMEEPKVIKVYNKYDEYAQLMNYLNHACDLLNRRKGLKFTYSPTRAYNCFLRHLRNEEAPVFYVDILRRMTDFELKEIRNVGPHTFDVLQMARDLALRDIPAPYSKDEIYEWSKSVVNKYREEKKDDSTAEKTEED